MKTKKKLLFVFALVFLWACRKESSISPEMTNSEINTSKLEKLDSNFIGLEQALTLARSAKIPVGTISPKDKVASLYNTSPKKTIKNYFIYSENVKNAVLKTKDKNYISDVEPILYAVNFEEGGASIVSSDKRFGEVLVYLDKNVNFKAGMNAPEAFINYLENASKTIIGIKENTIKQSENFLLSRKKEQTLLESRKKQLLSSTTSLPNKTMGTWEQECQYQDWPYGLFLPGVPFGNNLPNWTCETLLDYYVVNNGPLLQTEWDQVGSGYNDLVPFACGTGKAPTGCVATAMAQALSFSKYPTSYNWLSMNNLSGSSETARLMRDLGNMVDMNYACDGSGAYMSKANEAFHALGINTTYTDYDDTSPNPNLEKYGVQIRNRLTPVYDLQTGTISHGGAPVMVGGCRIVGQSGWWIFKRRYYSECHAWLIDGIRRHRYVTTTKVPGYDQRYYINDEELFHFNFGWGGFYNGWYKLDFSDNNGYINSTINFLQGQDIITDIYPH